ncbi:hypothetical protein NDN08_002081 [Rhodosorus marinus]|uniref:SCP domain-containing protein n=1 Tax=Rhodosorus marinus TaxID=101924 RepID=A0AAV8UU59_9RHOD|nr:hypothetical protein NDN08_002081 [Rhodosorus marinus]
MMKSRVCAAGFMIVLLALVCERAYGVVAGREVIEQGVSNVELSAPPKISFRQQGSCSDEQKWEVRRGSKAWRMKAVETAQSVKTWYGYNRKAETSQKPLIKVGRARVVIHVDTRSNTASLVIVNKRKAGITKGALRMEIRDLPPSASVEVEDDPSSPRDSYTRSPDGTTLNIKWTQWGRADGVAVKMPSPNFCIRIEVLDNDLVNRVQYMNGLSDVAVGVQASVGSKAKVCLVPKCSGGGGGGGGGGNEWVVEHNKLRNEVKVPPAIWDAEIAQSAQNWANELKNRGCVLQHSSSAFRRSTQYGYLGENLYYQSGYSSSDDIERRSITAFAEEVDDYRFGPSSNSCTRINGGVVGHYTAMVWSGTELLGCADVSCDTGGRLTQLVVCQYGAKLNCQDNCINNLIGGFPFCGRNLPKNTSGQTISRCSDEYTNSGC